MYCGHMQECDRDQRPFQDSFVQRIFRPLALAYNRVDIFVATGAETTAGWQNFFEPLRSNASIVVEAFRDEDLPHIETTRFRWSMSRHRDSNIYWLQYGHIWQSFLLLAKHEATRKTRYDYVVRCRNDYLFYDTFDPQWLSSMPCDSIAVPSTEFHTALNDRWMERQPSMWPAGMCDQLVFGPRGVMQHYSQLLFHNASRRLAPPSNGIESILAQNFQDMHVSVITVELRFRQARQHRYKLVASPCRYCWDPKAGTAGAGIGVDLLPLRPRVAACPADDAALSAAFIGATAAVRTHESSGSSSESPIRSHAWDGSVCNVTLHDAPPDPMPATCARGKPGGGVSLRARFAFVLYGSVSSRRAVIKSGELLQSGMDVDPKRFIDVAKVRDHYRCVARGSSGRRSCIRATPSPGVNGAVARLIVLSNRGRSGPFSSSPAAAPPHLTSSCTRRCRRKRCERSCSSCTRR